MATTDDRPRRQRKETLEQFRTDKFISMGFEPYDAERLAHAKDHRGFAIDSGDVAKLLERGCPKELAVAIMT